MFDDKIEMAKILGSSSIAFAYKMLGGSTKHKNIYNSLHLNAC